MSTKLLLLGENVPFQDQTLLREITKKHGLIQWNVHSLTSQKVLAEEPIFIILRLPGDRSKWLDLLALVALQHMVGEVKGTWIITGPTPYHSKHSAQNILETMINKGVCIIAEDYREALTQLRNELESWEETTP